MIKAFPTWGPFAVGVLAIPGKEIEKALSAVQVRFNVEHSMECVHERVSQ